jgi:regulator of protease activity HflC (stomatin/prohibitin superfamily)
MIGSALAFVVMVVVNTALAFVSAANSTEVIAGVAILIALVGATVHFGVPAIKKVFGVAMLALVIAGTTGACARMISPGHAGIKVNLYGDDKGVSSYPLVAGIVWYNPVTTWVFDYPTFVQQATWTKNPTEGSPNDDSITFNSVEGLAINTDIGLAYHLERGKVPAFYVKFRSDHLHNITHVYLRNVIRDSFNAIASIMKVEDIYGPKKETLLTGVREMVNKTTGVDGIVLDQLTIIGSMRLPQNVVDSLNAKIQATQQAIMVENQLRSAEAEAKKTVATAEGAAQAILKTAEAQAKANRLLAESITPVLVQYEMAKKWNGVMPQVTGGATPFVNLPAPLAAK